MRFTISILTFFVSISLTGQVKKITKEDVSTIGKIGRNIEITKTGNEYTITYNDINFTIDEYKSFSFKDLDNDFENLYKMISEGFETPPKDPIKIELPNDIIWLKFKKSLGTVNLQIDHAVDKNENVIGTSIFMTKRRVRKLFGKQRK